MLPPIPQTIQDLDDQGFEIIPPGEFDSGETVDAEAYWSSVKEPNTLAFYNQTQPWATYLAGLVQTLGVTSVFEFGCNVGRNLRCIREKNPDLSKLSGIDINPHAIAFGAEKNNLPLQVGGLDALKQMATGSYELVFTVSVLDHVPRISEAVAELVRTASRYVVCIEVTLPVEGKVVRYLDRNEGEVLDATAASYSWDIAKYLRMHRKVQSIGIKDYVLHPSRLGPYYKQYQAHLQA